MDFLGRDGAPHTSGMKPDGKVSCAIGRRAALGLGTAFAVVCLAGYSARAASEPGSEEARAFVVDLAAQAIAVMANGSLADDDRRRQFRNLFITSFDLPAIGQLVLGRHWHNARADQKALFLKLFEREQVLIWAGRFKYFSGQKMRVGSADSDVGGGWDVESHVDGAGGQPVPVDWKVIRSADGLRVIDLTIAGASMSLTLRQDFGSVLQANGGSFDALLMALQRKIDILGAG